MASALATIKTVNRRAVQYILLFGLIFGVSYFLIGIAPGVRMGILKPYTGLLAGAVAAIVNLFGGGYVPSVEAALGKLV